MYIYIYICIHCFFQKTPNAGRGAAQGGFACKLLACQFEAHGADFIDTTALQVCRTDLDLHPVLLILNVAVGTFFESLWHNTAVPPQALIAARQQQDRVVLHVKMPPRLQSTGIFRILRLGCKVEGRAFVVSGVVVLGLLLSPWLW